MKNLEKEQKKEELQLFRQKLEEGLKNLEEGLKNMKRIPVGTVRKWGNREYVKVGRDWVRLIHSENTGN